MIKKNLNKVRCSLISSYLELIDKRILVIFRFNQGYYRRLDAFQDDMFEVFETACRISRTDSQVIHKFLKFDLF